MSSHAATFVETMQGYADDFFAETQCETATAKEIATWLIKTRRWEPPPDLLLRQCREDVARAMREQYISDGNGRPVRAKHVARIVSGGTQKHLWADIRTAPHSFMVSALQQRREQIVGDCRQLKRDQDFCNEMHPEDAPIQLVFDFQADIEEGEFSTEYPPHRPH